MDKFSTSLFSAFFVLVVVFIISLNFESAHIREEDGKGYTDMIMNMYFDVQTKELNMQYNKSSELLLECDDYSHVTDRTDAYRCKNAKEIYDPCYVDDIKQSDKLACIDTPWDKNIKIAKLKSSLKLPQRKKNDLNNSQPFAIELEDKTKCIVRPKHNHAVKLFAGFESYSVCFDNNLSFVKSIVVGEIDKSKEQYKILMAHDGVVSKKKIKALYY